MSILDNLEQMKRNSDRTVKALNETFEAMGELKKTIENYKMRIRELEDELALYKKKFGNWPV